MDTPVSRLVAEPPSSAASWLIRLGEGTLAALRHLGALAHLASRTVAAAATPPYSFRPLVQQMEDVGVRSVLIAAVAAVFTGFVLALQTSFGLARFGAKGYVAFIVSLSMVRELGPVLTALLVGGRVGSGFTAELGAMRVTEQIDAMRVLGADPIRRLVVPRVMASALAFPLLTLVADLLGILGGMVVSWYEFQVEISHYQQMVLRALRVGDVLSGLGKAAIFGFLTGLIGCYNGLRASGGTEGIGRATTATVVTSSVTVLIADYFLTKAFWWLEGD